MNLRKVIGQCSKGLGGSVALNLSKIISQCSKVLGGSVALNLSKVSRRSKVLGGT